MESPSKTKITEILDRYDLAPLKKLGQNFLIDRNIIKKMVNLVEPDETVIEVGPGLGSLTVPTAKRVKELIAVEKDEKIVHILENEFLGQFNNVTLIKGDILETEGIIPSGNYSVLANLPFYITSPVIRMFLESKNPPIKMILMIQKEVAKRICAKPPEMSVLAVSVQFYAKPKILFKVSRNSFWPSPGVDCAVMAIERNSFPPKVGTEDFFRVVRAGFSHPRAQLLNNFSKELKLDKEKVKKAMLSSGIDPRRRAESLNLDEWLILTEKL